MKWEYQRLHKPMNSYSGGDMDAELARLGAEGWEAVAMTTTSSNAVFVLLKRPVER